jgi:hypothetical protein
LAYVTVADTEIQCLLGSVNGSGTGSALGYDVVVTLPALVGGVTTTAARTATLPNGFRYSPPTVTTITGEFSFFGGKTVTITGGNFGCPDPSDCVLPLDNVIERAVTIGGKQADNVTVVSHSMITAVTPPFTGFATIDNLPLFVTVEGVTNPVAFDFTYTRPAIFTVSDASIFGGVVTVTGENFGPMGTYPDIFLEEIKVAGR